MNKKSWAILVLIFIITIFLSIISWLIFETIIWALVDAIMFKKDIGFVTVITHFTSIVVLILMIMTFSPFGYKAFLKYKE